MIKNFNFKNNVLLKARKILGLAIDEKCITLSEIHFDKDVFHVKNSAEFVFPEGVSLENPAGLGDLLGNFLRENKFTAKRAVVGLPAKFFMIRPKDVPPTSHEAIAGILKIHAEHEFSLGPDELLIDYTGTIEPEKPTRLYIGAVTRKNYEKVIETVRVAGLSIISATVSSMALRQILSLHSKEKYPEYFLYVTPGYCDLIAGQGKQVIDVKHIRMDDKNDPSSCLSKIKRIISLSPGRNEPGTNPGMMIFSTSETDDCGFFNDIKNALSSLVDVSVYDTSAVTKKMGFSSSKKEKDYLVSASTAQAFYLKDAFYQDFFNSRINFKVVKIKKEQVVWASVIVFALLVFIAGALISYKTDKRDVAELKVKLAEIKDDVEAARSVVQKVNYARGWYSERPEILRCLYELTLSFPEEGRIWATNFALNEEMKGIISGKAVDEKNVIEVMDALKSSRLFKDVQMIYIRENGQSSQEVSFSMSFSFRDKEI